MVSKHEEKRTETARIMRAMIRASYLLALAAFLVAVALTLERHLLIGPLGNISSISLGSVALLYPLAQYRFQNVGYSPLKSVVLGLLYANAFLQTFELFYGLTFGLGYFLYAPISITGAEVRSFALWDVMISPVILVHDKLKFKATSALLLLLTAVVWVVWILYGYPQYYLPGSHAFQEYLKTSDPFQVSLLLNFGSKGLMALFFASLLEPSRAVRAALRRGSPGPGVLPPATDGGQDTPKQAKFGVRLARKDDMRANKSSHS